METVSGYSLLHGEAVAIGLVAQMHLAEKLGYATREDREEVESLLEQAKLPTEIPASIDREELVRKLYTDKKVKNGKLRFVVQKGIGSVVEFEEGVFATPVEEELAREITMKI